MFLYKIMYILLFGFSTQNHAESFENYLKKQVLDPRHAKLNQKSGFCLLNFRVSPPKIPPSFTEHLAARLRSKVETELVVTRGGN